MKQMHGTMSGLKCFRWACLALLLIPLLGHADVIDVLLQQYDLYFRDARASIGHNFERVPNGAVDPSKGVGSFDIPEVVIRGERGLDVALTRSYGKSLTGTRSLGNWDLEVPRLSLVTAPSTKLKGDSLAGGVCEDTGDVATGSYISNGATYYKYDVANTLPSSIQQQLSYQVVSSLLVNIFNNYLTDFLNGSYEYYNRKYQSGEVDAQAAFQRVGNSVLSVGTISGVAGSYVVTLKSSVAAGSASISPVKFISDAESAYSNKASILDGINQFIYGEYVLSGNPSLASAPGSNRPSASVLESKMGQWCTQNKFSTMQCKNRQNFLKYVDNYLQLKQSNGIFTEGKSNYTLTTNVDPRQRPLALNLPGEGARLFYPVQGAAASGFPAAAKYVSNDNWFISCGAMGGKGFTVHATNGVRYSFPEANRENQPGVPATDAKNYFPGFVNFYASRIEGRFGERFEYAYDNRVVTPPSGTSLPFPNFNPSNRLFLMRISQVLDNGAPVDRARLNYIDYAGEHLLKSIERTLDGRWVTAVSYDYSNATTGGLAADSQLQGMYAKSEGTSYLQSATYPLSGDVESYGYGGPYRLRSVKNGDANATYTTGVSGKGVLQYFSDIQTVSHSRNGVIGYSVNWRYKLYPDVSQKSLLGSNGYVIYQSDYNYGGKAYSITYEHFLPSTANHTQLVKVSLAGLSTVFLTYYYYDNGLAESPLHGYLANMQQDGRSTVYNWEAARNIGVQPKLNVSGAVDYVSMVPVPAYRLKSTSIAGSFGSEVTGFDVYDQPIAITEKGMNGTAPVSRSYSYALVNAAPAAVDAGGWWLLGLRKTVSSGGYVLSDTVYDSQFMPSSVTRAGVTTSYAYHTPSAWSCFSGFPNVVGVFNCLKTVMLTGDHTGQVYSVNVGGLLKTLYSAYKRGVAQAVELADGNHLTNEVNEYGDTVRSVDAAGLTTIQDYDDAGRLTRIAPANKTQATSTYNGYIVTVTRGQDVSVQTYDGMGQLIKSAHQDVSGAAPMVYQGFAYDFLGRKTFSGYPRSDGGSALYASGMFQSLNRPAFRRQSLAS